MLSLPLTDPTAIFLAVLTIILVIPLLFNRLNIPYIIGLIGAGMAVGPYGFNLLARDDSFRIFGEVGVLFLMFLAGVEINMFHLRNNYRQGLFFGLLTFLLPMATGVAGAMLLFHTDALSALLVGVMFASHTLLTYPVVNRFGLANNRAAVIAVCGTILAVLLALIVLAEAVEIKRAGGFSAASALWIFGRMVIFVAGWGVAAPFVTRHFFRKVNDGVMQFVYILAVVFMMSFTAQLAGIASIIGAFYAGLVLNKFIPARSALLRRLEFTGNAIFIPYFLIGVGMLINVRLLAEGWDVLLTALAMTLLALASKWVAAFGAGRLLRFDKYESTMVFGLSAGKAAATIAATMVGYGCGLLNETILNAAVLMILGCCIAASLATQRGALHLRMRITDRDLRSGDAGAPAHPRQLVAVANPITAEGLMRLAVLGRESADATPAVLLFVAHSDDPMHRAMGERSLRHAAESASAMGLDTHEVMRYDTNIVAGIVNAMKERACNEIYLGLHRPATGFDTFLGSMEEQLVRNTNTMIVMSRCFIPVNTVRRLFVSVPPKAHYETGFRRWVSMVAQLAAQIGVRAEVLCGRDEQPYVRQGFTESRTPFGYDFLDMESWDDFIILSSQVSEEDLLITVSARRHSISYSAQVENLPSYLDHNFRRHNLVVVYPEQFGTTHQTPAPAIDALSLSHTS